MSERGAATVVRTRLPWTLAPEQAARLVRGDARPFALIGSWAGGGALIGSEPVRVASPEEDPFALLDQQPRLVAGENADDATAGQDAAVAGGWFGYLGYELCHRVEPVGPSPPCVLGLAPFALAFYDHVLRLDAQGRWWFEGLWTPARAAALRARLSALEARAADPPRHREFDTEPWRATPAGAGHELAVQACRRRIHAGDLFQANICVRLESRLRGDPIDLFTAAAGRLGPDRAAFLSGPWGAVASLSPELFLERHGRRVRSAPIKGTRPRPDDAQAAARECDALTSSGKDRAENVMIVDLVRNDLGRVCVPGSIAVDALARARGHTGVWHLVSEVSGTLGDEVGDGRLVRAAFPPGSVTGAPKVAAMNVIAELESSARHVYTGAIGFASPVAGLELSVAIRTFEFAGERVWLGVGGGIVADSEPAAEAEECVTKAGPLLAAIGATLADDPVRAAPAAAPAATPPAPRRSGPRPIPRPDPAAGVFETVLVAGGRPVALELHLARLAGSVWSLYGRPLPAGLKDELLAAAAAAAAPPDRARLRVDVRPSGPDVTARLELTALTPREAPVELVPTTVPGGLGAHKWADRRLLDALREACGGEPLLCDLDGFVLEAARANVFALDGLGCRLCTPPADGRVLPGVTRARALELAPRHGLEVRIMPLHLNELGQASELFITGALGGVEPAQLERNQTAPGPVTVTARLAEALAELEAALVTYSTDERERRTGRRRAVHAGDDRS